MKYPCIESHIEFFQDNYLIRLWIDKKGLVDGNASDRIALIEKFRKFLYKTSANEHFVEVVEWATENIKGLNAIQISIPYGDATYGTVVYLVDFSSDVHG